MESALGKFLNYLRELGLFSKVQTSYPEGTTEWFWQNYKLIIDGKSESLALHKDVSYDSVDYELVYSFDRQVGHAFYNHHISNVYENDVIAVLAMYLVEVRLLGDHHEYTDVIVPSPKFNTGSVPEALMTESSMVGKLSSEF